MSRFGGEYPDDWKALATEVKAAAGWVCIRCEHPHDPSNGYTLTVHHLDGQKDNCRWWNLAALCQRCHLHIQAKVVMQRTYMFDHSEWFKPYVAGYYAFHAGLPHDRESVQARMDEYLSLALTTSPQPKPQPEIWKIDNGHWQVRMTDGDIISNHSDRQGAQRMIERMAEAQPYEPPRLTFTAPIPAAVI